MPNLEQLAMTLLQKNPNVANSPQGQQFMEILKSGDVAKGQQMADNICKSYGIKREDAYNQAKKFFNL